MTFTSKTKTGKTFSITKNEGKYILKNDKGFETELSKREISHLFGTYCKSQVELDEWMENN